ncbi:hypothetical protein [Dyadobacter helix]|nr:hypothetical protein [Dyadobacter sp. CECT 9275]
MKTEKVSLRLVLVMSLGLVFGLWFAFGKVYRICRNVRKRRGEYGGAMDKLNRVTNFKRQVDKIVAGLPAKAHRNRRRARL